MYIHVLLQLADMQFVCIVSPLLRRGKLNSQFIVTRFSVLHAGGRSLFRFHISPTATFSMIARDKKLTRLCSPAFRDLRRS